MCEDNKLTTTHLGVLNHVPVKRQPVVQIPTCPVAGVNMCWLQPSDQATNCRPLSPFPHTEEHGPSDIVVKACENLLAFPTRHVKQGLALKLYRESQIHDPFTDS